MASETGGRQAVIGWDIGGAHLKAARVEDGRVVAVVQEPCALWQGLDRLEAAFAAIESQIGAATLNPVTMTGELADLFESRRHGVTVLAGVAASRLARASIYAGAQGFLAPAAAEMAVDAVASANWHATAALVARSRPAALLVDIGSTTSDLVPILGGRTAARGSTDAARMRTGELVYTGAVRTPLMAVTEKAPVSGAWTGVMAEYFATMADANRLLGRLPEEADQHATADGRGKTVEESRLRLSRMVGRDVADLPESSWTGLAAWFAEAQLRRLHDAALLVLSGSPLPADAPVVACGAGRAAAFELARRLARQAIDLAELVPVAGNAPADLAARASTAAPSVAVALLACSAL